MLSYIFDLVVGVQEGDVLLDCLLRGRPTDELGMEIARGERMR
jgi:hypothetical protein